MSDERIAPEGQRWVCMACGKHTIDRYSEERGWDESCMLNSVLVNETDITYSVGNHRVVSVDPKDGPRDA